MKTAGRITTTLALLLGVYLLSYWLLIKKDWADKLLGDPGNSSVSLKGYEMIYSIFAPISELELILSRDIPTRKYLIGHWRSETNSDFVTIGPKHECHFQLSGFASKGEAKYNREKAGLLMEFSHQNQVHIFTLSYMESIDPFGPNPPILHSAELAYANVEHTPKYSNPITDYKATLTKHPPSPPPRNHPALPPPQEAAARPRSIPHPGPRSSRRQPPPHTAILITTSLQSLKRVEPPTARTRNW